MTKTLTAKKKLEKNFGESKRQTKEKDAVNKKSWIVINNNQRETFQAHSQKTSEKINQFNGKTKT